MVAPEDTAVKKQESLTSWSLHSSGGKQTTKKMGLPVFLSSAQLRLQRSSPNFTLVEAVSMPRRSQSCTSPTAPPASLNLRRELRPDENQQQSQQHRLHYLLFAHLLLHPGSQV